MTITRLAQFTAETRILTDITILSGSISYPSISSAQAKTGTYSYSAGAETSTFGKALPAGISAGRMGWWMYMDSSAIGNTTSALFYIGDGNSGSAGANHIRCMVNDSIGEITIERPNGNNSWATLATATMPTQFSTTGTWFHVGVTLKIDDTDGFCTVYINGLSVISFTGDTRPSSWSSGPGTVYTITAKNWLGPTSTSGSGAAGWIGIFVDDAFLDSIFGEFDSPVPSRRFLLSLPTSAGVDDDWTAVPAVANYLNVDDNPNDIDTTYNKALSADLRDTFNVTDITLPADHFIVAVIPNAFAKRLDSEIAHQLSVHAWDGSQYGDSADIDLTMAYDVPVFARLTLQPDGSEWNETDYNAMQFGYRSRGSF